MGKRECYRCDTNVTPCDTPNLYTHFVTPPEGEKQPNFKIYVALRHAPLYTDALLLCATYAISSRRKESQERRISDLTLT